MGPVARKIKATCRKIEGRFLYLFLTLVALLAFYPYFGVFGNDVLVLSIFYVAIPIAGMYAAGFTKRLRIIALAFGIPAIVGALSKPAEHFLPDPAGTILGTVFYVFAMGSILAFIVKQKRITADTIYGAVSLYLLLGVTWAGIYVTVEEFMPGSFYVQDVHNPDGVLDYGEFFYYSFVTLTTLGYGEIAPVTNQARSLAILEALSGVLFTGVLIARLVGMYSAHDDDDE